MNVVHQWSNYINGQYFKIEKNLNEKENKKQLKIGFFIEKTDLTSVFYFTIDQLKTVDPTKINRDNFDNAIKNVNITFEKAYNQLDCLSKLIYNIFDCFGCSFIAAHRQLRNQLTSMAAFSTNIPTSDATKEDKLNISTDEINLSLDNKVVETKVENGAVEQKVVEQKGPIAFKKINLGLNGRVQFDIIKIEDLFAQDKKILGDICENNRTEFNQLKVKFDPNYDNSENFKGPFNQLGRSKDYIASQITVKSRKELEADDAFEKEAKMQVFLNQKKEKWGLKSQFPTPLHYTNDTFYYKRTDGYHHYLTDIKDQADFNTSLNVCAHDLGALLKQGIAYHELISVFHGTSSNSSLKKKDKSTILISNNEQGTVGRFYTLFPQTVGAYACAKENGKKIEKGTTDGGYQSFGGFAGKIDYVCSAEHHLYPDCGQDGLRDLGDFVWIDEHFKEIQQLHACKNFNESAAIAHFASLYHMVFLLIIAKRAQALELQGEVTAEIWQTTSNSFKEAIKSFLMAFQPDNPLVGDDNLEKIADWERFTKQLQFSFTTKNRETSCGWQHRNEDYKASNEYTNKSWVNATESIPSESTINEIWGPQFTWEKSYSRAYQKEELTNYSTDKGFEGGHLGNYSAPNPLFDGIQAIYNMVYFMLNT